MSRKHVRHNYYLIHNITIDTKYKQSLTDWLTQHEAASYYADFKSGFDKIVFMGDNSVSLTNDPELLFSL